MTTNPSEIRRVALVRQFSFIINMYAGANLVRIQGSRQTPIGYYSSDDAAIRRDSISLSVSPTILQKLQIVVVREATTRTNVIITSPIISKLNGILLSVQRSRNIVLSHSVVSLCITWLSKGVYRRRILYHKFEFCQYKSNVCGIINSQNSPSKTARAIFI